MQTVPSTPSPSPSNPPSENPSENLAERVATEVPRALTDLADLVAIPSVSSLAEHDDDVRRSAEAVCALYRAEGVAARVVTTAGARPAVLGRKQGPAGAPTVLLYAHHDVQPVGPLTAWTAPPYEMTQRDGRAFGRGTSDDKGAIALHLALLRAFGDDLPVTLVVLVEGEEEIGSPTIDAFLAAHAEELRADVVLVPDAVNPDPATPSHTVGLRGNADLVVRLSTLTRPVHSGLYGGVLPCALTSLVQLLASLHDDRGCLVVDGLLSTQGDAPEVLLDREGIVLDGVGEVGAGSLGERLVMQPSVTVLAVDAVSVEQASNVLHPSATAKLGVRVPPGQDPDVALTAVEEHLRSRVRFGARLELERGRSGSGFLAPRDDDRWGRSARTAYGRDSVRIGAGGSIPFIAALADLLPTADFLVTAVQDSGSNAHSVDESLHLEGFARACHAHALLLVEIGA